MPLLRVPVTAAVVMLIPPLPAELAEPCHWIYP